MEIKARPVRKVLKVKPDLSGRQEQQVQKAIAVMSVLKVPSDRRVLMVLKA